MGNQNITLTRKHQKQFNKDLKEILKKLDQIPEAIGVTPTGRIRTKKAAVTRALNKTAKLFIPILQKNTPEGDAPHYRGKKANRIKYYPGNARGSMKLLRFKKASPLLKYVGTKYIKNPKQKSYGKGKYDGYYVRFLEDGSHKGKTKYNIFKKSFMEGKPQILPTFQKHVEKIFKDYFRKKNMK